MREIYLVKYYTVCKLLKAKKVILHTILLGVTPRWEALFKPHTL